MGVGCRPERSSARSGQYLRHTFGKPTGLEDYIGWLANNFDPSISLEGHRWIREFWDGPMVIKGSSTRDHDAVRFGADGIVVSNHGGRQLDSVLSSIARPAGHCRWVKGDIAILADSGSQLATDVVPRDRGRRHSVLLGRAYLYTRWRRQGLAGWRICST